MKTLNGLKTYLGLIGLGGLGICVAQGWIEGSIASTLAVILSTWTGVAIKHSWDKKAKNGKS